MELNASATGRVENEMWTVITEHGKSKRTACCVKCEHNCYTKFQEGYRLGANRMPIYEYEGRSGKNIQSSLQYDHFEGIIDVARFNFQTVKYVYNILLKLLHILLYKPNQNEYINKFQS